MFALQKESRKSISSVKCSAPFDSYFGLFAWLVFFSRQRFSKIFRLSKMRAENIYQLAGTRPRKKVKIFRRAFLTKIENLKNAAWKKHQPANKPIVRTKKCATLHTL
jgi:hypothetical protein